MDFDRPARTVTPEIIDNPATVDIITPYNKVVQEQVNAASEIYAGKMLSGNYILLYSDREHVEGTISEAVGDVVAVFPTVMGLLGKQDMDSAGITLVQQSGYDGQGVLMGFVDTGIDYTNQAFRHDDGSTRIRYLWDQTIPGAPPQPDYFLGTEYTMDQINQALATDAPRRILPHRDSAGHGTFLASVAAGSDQGEICGVAPESELIVVKLRRAGQFVRDWYMIPPDQEHAYSSSDVMMGVEYIVEKAVELGRPVAITIGLGSTFNGHDGFDYLENYLAQMANRSGVVISVAAGNEALARHHFQGQAVQDSPQVMEIQCEEAPSGMSVQIWNGGGNRLSVSVMSPTGELVSRVPARPGAFSETSLILERSVVRVEYYFPLAASGSQLTWVKITDPTPGVWKITVYGDIITRGRFDAWLPLTGFAPPGMGFLTPSPNTTVTVPGTALGVMVVGAYNSATGGLYQNSSWGPTRLPIPRPDLCAPGVDISGVYPTGHGAMTGTSVAAAIAAGAGALMLQSGMEEGGGQSLNTYWVRSYLIRGCDRREDIQYPSYQWGYGTLNLSTSFRQMGEKLADSNQEIQNDM